MFRKNGWLWPVAFDNVVHKARFFYLNIFIILMHLNDDGQKKVNSESTGGNSGPLAFLARIAGLLYLVIIACGIFSEIYIRARLIVPGNAASTAANILASPMLFRVGFASDSIMLLSDVAIAILFYLLLKHVNKTLAIMAAAFRLAQAAILGGNLLHYHGALLLLDQGGYIDSLAVGHRQALMMFFLDLHGHGYDLGLLFFAVSSFILIFFVFLSSGFICFTNNACEAELKVEPHNSKLFPFNVG